MVDVAVGRSLRERVLRTRSLRERVLRTGSLREREVPDRPHGVYLVERKVGGWHGHSCPGEVA
jgi:hypothetical protein